MYYNNSLCPFIVHATSSNYKCLPPNQNMTADLYQSFHFPNAEDNVGRASSRLAESIAHPKSSSQRLMLAIPFPCPLLLSFHNIILPRSTSVEVRVAPELHVRSAVKAVCYHHCATAVVPLVGPASARVVKLLQHPWYTGW